MSDKKTAPIAGNTGGAGRSGRNQRPKSALREP